MLLVGLSGGIGSGKSTVSRRLAQRGAQVIDADVLAREVVAPATAGLAAVVERFGGQVLTERGDLDRAALGRLVFADAQARADLERITHPLIAARTAELVAAAPPGAVVVHDVPLLVEKAMAARYDVVVVVHAPQATRLRRLVRDRGTDADDARRRMAAQATDEQRREVADVWLDNDGDLDGLLRQVDRLWEETLAPAATDRSLRP